MYMDNNGISKSAMGWGTHTFPIKTSCEKGLVGFEPQDKSCDPLALCLCKHKYERHHQPLHHLPPAVTLVIMWLLSEVARLPFTQLLTQCRSSRPAINIHSTGCPPHSPPRGRNLAQCTSLDPVCVMLQPYPIKPSIIHVLTSNWQT
jgi:hypothetical protein